MNNRGKPAAQRTAPVIHSLAELKSVKRKIDETARQAAEEAERQRKEARQAREDANLFRNSVGGVTPQRESGRMEHARARPAPHPTQRERDEQNVLRESISDEFDVETLLDTDEALSYRRTGVGPDVVRKLRRGDWALQAQLDLHGLRRDEAREAVGAFLRDAVRQGLRCVRIVHGKGLGSPGKTPVLKARVQGWLIQKEEVLAYTQARAADGGAGALVVLLRPSPLAGHAR